MVAPGFTLLFTCLFASALWTYTPLAEATRHSHVHTVAADASLQRLHQQNPKVQDPKLHKAKSNTLKTKKGEEYKVALELFVMSKCPDAQRCEARINDVLKQIHPIVRVSTSYIADQSGAVVRCRHGPAECAGNMQQLCAYKYSPGENNYKTFWSFLICQNAKFTDVGEHELAVDCLAQSGFSAKASKRVQFCMTGFEGEGLLKQSVAKTKDLGVQKSCTIYINGEYSCTHDGGEWYNCIDGSEVTDFVDTICSQYHEHTGNFPDVCKKSLGLDV